MSIVETLVSPLNQEDFLEIYKGDLPIAVDSELKRFVAGQSKLVHHVRKTRNVPGDRVFHVDPEAIMKRLATDMTVQSIK